MPDDAHVRVDRCGDGRPRQCHTRVITGPEHRSATMCALVVRRGAPAAEVGLSALLR